MNRVNRNVESRVIDLHFKGFPRDTIAHQLRISSATVSEILTILPPVLKPLRILSTELRKNNLITQDAIEGVRILNGLRAIGIRPEQYSASLQAITKTAVDTKYNPECVIQAATRLVELENKADKGFPEALKEYDMITKKTCKKKRQNKKLKMQNLQLRSKISEKEKRLAQLFKAADETPEDISKFKKTKTKLLQYKLSFNDVDAIIKLLENLTEAGGNVKRLISLVKKVGSLTKKKAELKKNTMKMNQELTNIKTQKENAECELHLTLDLTSEQEKMIQNNQYTIAFQTNQIQWNYSQFYGLCTDYKRIESLRREAINRIGRMTGMNENEITNLQLEASLDIAYQTLQKRFEETFYEYKKRFF